MGAVKSFCTTGIILDKGQLSLKGSVDEIMKEYLGAGLGNLRFREGSSSDKFHLISAGISNVGASLDEAIYRDIEIKLEFQYDNFEHLDNLYFNIKIKDDEGNYLITTCSDFNTFHLKFGVGFAKMLIPAGFFNEGNYLIDLMIIQKTLSGYDFLYEEKDFLWFQVLPEERLLGYSMGKELGFIRHTFDWLQ
jgi:uncharacterized protein YciU (UPF0263 family)